MGTLKTHMKRIVLTLILGIVTTAAVWYGFSPLQTREPISTSLPILASATVFPTAQPIANFSLTDTAQKPFTENNLVGNWTLLFFGYAHCPEICPKALATASNFWKQLPDTTRAKTRFVFITLDPKEDKVDDLKSFLGRFHSEFIGLTGDESEINKLAKSCRVYSFEDPTLTTAGQKNIDHTAAFILINPEGRMQALFSPPYDSATIAKDLATLMLGRS